MKNWLALAIATAAALSLWPAAAPRAGLGHDPALTWRTLHTPHFAVHYHDGEERLAREAAAIAERLFERFAPIFDWRPAEPIEIVLTDEYDVSNGWTTFFPANRIAIFTAPPDEVFSLEDHGGWLETVILHELVHALHLDKARGAPHALRYAFGRLPLLFPNAYQPAWLLEGLATYYETDRARGMGRGQSSFFDMLMRMEVAGGIKPLREINQTVDRWPAGFVPYLYGVYFHNFIAERYGERKLQELVHNYSGNLLPYFVNANAQRTFGKDYKRLWRDFERYLHEKYDRELEAIRAAGLVEGERLSREGYFAGALRVAEDGTAYYVAFDGYREPALMAWRPGARAPARLAEVPIGTRLDFNPRAGLLAARPEVCRNARWHYDLYRYDPRRGGSGERLTHCARYIHAAWRPDGEAIAAVEHRLGRHRLVLLDARGRFIEEWWSGEDGAVFGGLDWSPDGRSLVAALWRPRSGWNLERFFIAERRWQALTQTAGIESAPRFTRDGRAVLFSADYGGVYNLRRLDLETGRIETLTNVLGGAFSPDAAPDGTVYYIGYTPQGFDLFRLAEPKALPTPRTPAGPSAVIAAAPEPDPAWRSEPYCTLCGLRPRWWFPHLVLEEGRSEVGATTSGSHALVRHVYAVDAAYDFSNDSPVGSLVYLYDGWYPLLRLGAERVNRFTRASDTNEVLRVRHEDSYSIELIQPWLRWRRGLTLHWGAVAERRHDGYRAASEPPEPHSRDTLAGFALVWDSTRDYPLSISRSHGREVRLIAETADAFGRSDYSGAVYVADWREFWHLGVRHVLALRLVEGWGTDDPRPFRLGGADTAAQGLPLIDSPFNVRDYALRGYAEGLAALAGRRMRLGSLEYRFPIVRVDRGTMWPIMPLALHQLSGTLFVDSGAAWNEGRAPDHYATGAGFELMADVALGYSARFSLRLGYAHGFDLGEDDRLYLRVGAAF
jgi:hypothetical protein